MMPYNLGYAEWFANWCFTVRRTIR